MIEILPNFFTQLDKHFHPGMQWKFILHNQKLVLSIIPNYFSNTSHILFFIILYHILLKNSFFSFFLIPNPTTYYNGTHIYHH